MFGRLVVKFGRRETGKIVRYLPYQKAKFCLPLKLSLLRGSLPKITRASPQQCTQTQSALHFIQMGFTFGRVIDERVNTAKSPRKVNLIFGQSLASSQIISFQITKCLTDFCQEFQNGDSD